MGLVCFLFCFVSDTFQSNLQVSEHFLSNTYPCIAALSGVCVCVHMCAVHTEAREWHWVSFFFFSYFYFSRVKEIQSWQRTHPDTEFSAQRRFVIQEGKRGGGVRCGWGLPLSKQDRQQVSLQEWFLSLKCVCVCGRGVRFRVSW